MISDVRLLKMLKYTQLITSTKLYYCIMIVDIVILIQYYVIFCNLCKMPRRGRYYFIYSCRIVVTSDSRYDVLTS